MRPVVLGFLCRWCAAKALENLAYKRLKLPEGFLPLRVNCSGAVDLPLLTRTLVGGVCGVLVGGCPRGQCHYREGNTRASLRLEAYRRLLAALGISPQRVRMVEVGSGEGEKLWREVWRFWEEISGESSSL